MCCLWDTAHDCEIISSCCPLSFHAVIFMRTPSSLWENLLSSSYRSCTRCEYAASRYHSSELASTLRKSLSILSSESQVDMCSGQLNDVVLVYRHAVCWCSYDSVSYENAELTYDVRRHSQSGLCWLWRRSLADWNELLDTDDVHARLRLHANGIISLQLQFTQWSNPDSRVPWPERNQQPRDFVSLALCFIIWAHWVDGAAQKKQKKQCEMTSGIVPNSPGAQGDGKGINKR